MASLKELKKNYSYDPSDIKWISRGGDLWKYLGMEVLKIEFKKIEGAEGEESKWDSKMGRAVLISTSDFDPMTETCVVKWKEVDYSKPDTEWETKETRIVPPGFSFGNPEEVGEMIRFIPLSLHMEKMEIETLFQKLRYLYNNFPSMEIGDVNMMAEGGDRKRILQNVHNIALVVNPLDNPEEIYSYRVGNISCRHQFKTVYKITTEDTEGKGELTMFFDSSTPEKLEVREGGKTVAYAKLFDLRKSFALKEES